LFRQSGNFIFQTEIVRSRSLHPSIIHPENVQMTATTRSRATVAVALLATGLGAWRRPPRSTPVPPPNVTMSAVAEGMVVLNTDRGTVTFCTYISEGNMPGIDASPRPVGKCARIGAVGASAAGYAMIQSTADVFIYNKSTGYVFQCVTLANPADGTAFGLCHQMANTSTM
jgi:hypothetical protein